MFIRFRGVFFMGNGIANYGRIDVISLPSKETTEKHKTGWLCWFIGNLSIMVVETFKEHD